MSAHSNFGAALVQELLDSFPNFFGADNWAEGRFGPYQSSFKRDAAMLAGRLLKKKMILVPHLDVVPGSLDEVMSRLDGLSAFYDHLEDSTSKDILVKLIAYRILGYQKVRIPCVQDRLSALQQHDLKSLEKSTETIKITFLNWSLKHLDFTSMGYPVECFAIDPFGFLLLPYAYSRRQPPIAAGPGDVVIDGGACFGDTALYFGHMVGERGKVFSFEFLPENLAVFHRNMALNPSLAPRIELVPNALDETSNRQISYVAMGPGTKLTAQGDASQTVSTLSIDDLVEQKSLDRVDFIKMDIEGAEMSALCGAEKTLRKFKPKLAVCLYHSLDDFVRIPEFLDRLGLSYRFYLDHTTTHLEETVLFADSPVRQSHPG